MFSVYLWAHWVYFHLRNWVCLPQSAKPQVWTGTGCELGRLYSSASFQHPFSYLVLSWVELEMYRKNAHLCMSVTWKKPNCTLCFKSFFYFREKITNARPNPSKRGRQKRAKQRDPPERKQADNLKTVGTKRNRWAWCLLKMQHLSPMHY